MIFNWKDIEVLCAEARNSPRKTSRICLHSSHSHSVQEMIIAHHKDTYTPPHSHLGKSVSYHIMKGVIRVLLFSETGQIKNSILLHEKPEVANLGFRLNENQIYMPLILSDIAVFHEVIEGPFVQGKSSFIPDWAPCNVNEQHMFLDNLGIGDYLNSGLDDAYFK